MIGKIPYNQALSQLQGRPVTQIEENEAASAIRDLWHRVTILLGV